WGCNTVYTCSEVCPKQVPSTQGITALRRKILMHKLKIR
ncbi:MAG: succinate dehydrogenase/fumarate reductase iron-sulfur subunit, partial [Euryarchaeota archaeon]|nr:succinate dehydrogenase/fumarate reductase iron-sulfur subunit [Euryarchaeota archaeon]